VSRESLNISDLLKQQRTQRASYRLLNIHVSAAIMNAASFMMGWYCTRHDWISYHLVLW